MVILDHEAKVTIDRHSVIHKFRVIQIRYSTEKRYACRSNQDSKIAHEVDLKHFSRTDKLYPTPFVVARNRSGGTKNIYRLCASDEIFKSRNV